MYCTSTILEKCLKFTKPKSSDINKENQDTQVKAHIKKCQNQAKVFHLPTKIAFVELFIKLHYVIVIVNVVKIVEKLQAWHSWWIKTALDSETLFQDRIRAIHSFFWIKGFDGVWILQIAKNFAVCGDVPRFYQENWPKSKNHWIRLALACLVPKLLCILDIFIFAIAHWNALQIWENVWSPGQGFSKMSRSQALTIYRLSQLRSFK